MERLRAQISKKAVFKHSRAAVLCQYRHSTAHIIGQEYQTVFPAHLFFAFQEGVVKSPTSFNCAVGVFYNRLPSFVFIPVI